MGVLEHVSRILLVAKADTTDATRKIKQLEGDQKKAAKATLEAQEQVNQGLERQIIRLGKVAIGVGVAAAAFKGLSVAATRYSEHAIAVEASFGANIKAIQESARGLMSEQEALQFAAAAMNTEYRLTQKEMQTVARFMVNLRNTSNDFATVQREVTKSIVEANAEGLKKYGIFVNGATGHLKTHNKILKEIELQNAATGSSMDRAGDEAKRASVKWKDAMDRLVRALGKIAVALSPIVTMLAQIMDGLAGGDTSNRMTKLARQNVLKNIAADQAKLKMMEKYSKLGVPMMWGETEAAVRKRLELNRLLDEAMSGRVKALSEPPKHRDVYAKKVEFKINATEAEFQGFDRWGPGESRFAPSFGTRGDVVGIRGVRKASLFGAAGGFETSFENLIGSSIDMGGKKESFFSVISQGHKRLQEMEVEKKIAAELRDVWELTGDAMAAAAAKGFDAWITGAESVGGAIKKGIAEGIRALANDMFIKSLYHAAAAIGALATGNVPGAKLHGEAALAFGAGAVAAGALAKSMGAGQGATKGGRGVGAGARPGGGGGDGQRSETIIIGTIDDNPRRRRRDLQDLLDRSAAENGPGLHIIRA